LPGFVAASPIALPIVIVHIMTRIFVILLSLLHARTLVSAVDPRIHDVNNQGASSAESVPAIPNAENATAIQTVDQQRPYPRFWIPRVGSTFQIVLSGVVDLDHAILVPSHVDVFDIDLFDTSRNTIMGLKIRGKKVICYFSAGTSENWRPDYNEISPQLQGASLPLWPGEKWLDIRREETFEIMRKRIRRASEIGCDAIDPDNMGKDSLQVLAWEFKRLIWV
jgi:hypothetical protein